MKTEKTYKIGTYTNGQRIADEVFISANIGEIKAEFMRMVIATNQEESYRDEWIAIDPNIAWDDKHFQEDVNHVAVFACENEWDECIPCCYSDNYNKM